MVAGQKRKLSQAAGREISLYLVVQFGRRKSPWAAGVYEVKIVMEEGEQPKVRGKEEEVIDPVVKFFEQHREVLYMSCGVLGSDLLYCFFANYCWRWNSPVPTGMRSFIVNPQTKNVSEIPRLAIETKVNPLVISADGKFFVLSNTRILASGVPQPSFEVFDPNSGASVALPPPPFHSKSHYEAPHEIRVTGSVVINDCILVCVYDSRITNCSFHSYHWGPQAWKPVRTTRDLCYPAFSETACVVGGRIYGCSFLSGVPLSYGFSIDDMSKDFDVPYITLGSPVLYQDLVEPLLFMPLENRYRFGRIVPLGKDMLCFSHTHHSSNSPNAFLSQHLQIKILKIQDSLSLKVLSSTSRALNIKGVQPALLSNCFILG